MGRVFKAVGRGAGRRVEVRLDHEDREVLATLLLQVHDLLEDDSSQAPGDGDPLAELTGMDPRAFSRRPASFAPDDPAVARLLPDAHRDDPALAEEFRRLTEHGLRQRKREGLQVAAAALRRPDQPLRLSAGEAQSLLKGITDLRLVLAERLGLATDEDAAMLHHVLRAALEVQGAGDEEGPPVADQPWVQQAAFYEHLTALQELLIEALTR